MGREDGTKRQSTLSKGMRVVDDDTRRQVLLKRLNALEADNYQEETFNEEEEESDEGAQQKRKKTKTTGRSSSSVLRRKPKSLERILDEERYAKESIDYDKVDSGPSSTPRRHFCSVCGYLGQYSCTRCGSRYCSIKCDANHKETRCLKFSI
jgi:zinc finger HIT domain-containing protein 1